MADSLDNLDFCESQKDRFIIDGKYKGKLFSILGDSISTLEGYNPRGYNVHYKNEVCENSGVRYIDDTWWGIVLKNLGGELLVNSSWSGTRTTHLSDRLPLFPSTSSKKRVNSLGKGNISPDVIIIYIGINDCGNAVKIGEKTTRIIPFFEFTASYSRMLNLIRKKYPNTEIWCCTLNTFYIPGDENYKFPYNSEKKDIEKFNEAIKRVVAKNKCKLLDIYSYGIAYETDDGLHPNSQGMKTMAKLVIKSICQQS